MVLFNPEDLGKNEDIKLLATEDLVKKRKKRLKPKRLEASDNPLFIGGPGKANAPIKASPEEKSGARDFLKKLGVPPKF